MGRGKRIDLKEIEQWILVMLQNELAYDIRKNDPTLRVAYYDNFLRGLGVCIAIVYLEFEFL